MRLPIPRRPKGFAARALLVAFSGTAVLALAAYLFPPQLARLAERGRIVYGRDGSPIAYYPDTEGEWKYATTAKETNPLMLRMLVRIEDRRFWYDPGVDPLAILRATGQLIISGHVVSGASTLTMQVVRLLNPAPRTLPVKLREAFQAISLTEHYSKRHILSMWLSLAPFGGNIVGVDAASRLWFGKAPLSLSPAQAALLIALCRRPEALRPDRHPRSAKLARNHILAEAAADGVISPSVAAQAETEPVPRHVQAFSRQSPQLTIRLASGTRTTLAPALNAALGSLGRRTLGAMRRGETLAILIADTHSRAIRAAFLGDFANPQRAGFLDLSRAIRSPGSALKPFLYGLAFADGIAGPSTLLHDLPRDFASYGPDDFTHHFMGTVTAASALRRSLNLPAVMLMSRYGPNRFAAHLAAAGAPLALPEGDSPSLPITLGGDGISMRRLGALYAALATDGRVERLHDVIGKRYPALRLLSPAIAREITGILTRPLPGYTAKGIAWKTGTSAGNRDDWAIGFDHRHLVMVWVGRPDGGALPGGAAIDRAIPILAQAFGLLKIVPFVPLPPIRPFSLVEVKTQAPLVIAYPPPHAILTNLGTTTLRVSGGVRPVTFLIDGTPLKSVPALRSARFAPSGPGYYHLRVIDAEGDSVAEILRVGGTDHTAR